jgi:subtilisin family serine protease|nr:MAG: peptidase S8 [bacterium]
MKPLSLLLATLIALGACATPPAADPTPRPTPTADAPPTADTPPAREAPPPEPAEPVPSDAPAMAPDHWWLKDASTDGSIGASVERAYRELLAGKQPRRTVIVGVIDSGIDTEHEDLRANIWVNEGEIPGNGVDDDGNGYVDDIHGWNFIGGPDGRNIDKDTYEVTRLYARDSVRFHGARVDTLSPAARADYERYQEVRQAYIEMWQETQEMLQQVRMIAATMDQVNAILRRHLGTDSLTVERVSAIASPRQDVQQARSIFLQLASHGITPEVLEEERQRLEDLERYGLNPAFNPRPLVGDDTLNLNERGYGNNDVRGPDATHGTHVAGIIAAIRDNGIGIDGIAPDVRIMVIRAVPDGDERDKDVANAIRYAVDNGAHIINMSFGKSWSPNKEAVDAAVRYADERGVLLVHGAGNDAKDLRSARNFPNRYYLDGDSARHWIEVGASSWEGKGRLAASFSNYGAGRVDVFAPGVAIRSTVPDNGYRTLSGTSMAAPVVTGIAALIMAYYPELDAAEVRRVILESATRYADQPVVPPGRQDGTVPFGDLSTTGGIVNAYAAIQMAERLAAAKRN